MLRRSNRWVHVVVIVVVLCLEWTAVSAVVARLILRHAQHDVSSARALVRTGDVDTAIATAKRVQRETSAARRLLGGPLWGGLASLGVVSSARDLLAITDDVSHQVLPPLVTAAGLLEGGRLKDAHGGVDIATLEEAAGYVHQAQAAIADVLGRLARERGKPLSSARAQLVSAVRSVSKDLDAAARATSIAPALLGVDGVRRYVLVFQNTAELRGTGGLIGSYAEIEADHGRLRLVRSGSDPDLHDAPVPFPISPDFDERWGTFDAGSSWKNVNESPHFPWVAQAVTDLWQRQFGESVDGVVALDTEGAAALVGATGPITLSNGVRLTASGFTRYLQQDLYLAYPTTADALRRQEVLKDLLHQLFTRVEKSQDAGPLVGALVHDEAQGHLRLWSSHPAEQAQLAGTLLAGELPDRPGPFAGAIIDNAGANKVDSFLHVAVSWSAQPCAAVATDGRRTSTLQVTLRNDIPTKYLHPYLAGTSGQVLPGVPLGRDYAYLSLYAGVGATDPQLTVDGVATPALGPEVERNHPVTATYVTVDPGRTVTVRVTWREPAVGAVQPLLLQSLVNPPTTKVAVQQCQ